MLANGSNVEEFLSLDQHGLNVGYLAGFGVEQLFRLPVFGSVGFPLVADCGSPNQEYAIFKQPESNSS
jgi:hypothetical protein